MYTQLNPIYIYIHIYIGFSCRPVPIISSEHSQAHESATGEHLLNKNACQVNYSQDWLVLFYSISTLFRSFNAKSSHFDKNCFSLVWFMAYQPSYVI